MLTPKFFGTIKDSKLYFDRREIFDIYLGTLESQRVEVIVKRVKKMRSQKSNRYYWAYINLVSSETGQDQNELHQLFKNEFLPKREVKAFGKTILLPPSTTELTTVELSEYLDRICALTGIPLLDPNEYYN